MRQAEIDGPEPQAEALWDLYRRNELDISQLTDEIGRRGSIAPVLAELSSSPDKSTALHVLSELPLLMVRPIWREVLPCLPSHDQTVTFYCLDILHSFLEEATVPELLRVILGLRGPDLSKPLVFGKAYGLVTGLKQAVLAELADAARKDQSAVTQHRDGLQVLANPGSVPDGELLKRLRSESPIARLYAACAIGRYRAHAPQLVAQMPEPARRRLEIERAHPKQSEAAARRR
jgi:hypothetical protein